jgi:hypothetical protein
VSFKPAAGDDKAAKGREGSLDLAVSMKKVQPGIMRWRSSEYGDTDVSKVSLTAYTAIFTWMR